MSKKKELVPLFKIFTKEKLYMRRKISSLQNLRTGRLSGSCPLIKFNLALRSACFQIILPFVLLLILTSIPPGFAQETSNDESENPGKEKVYAFGYDIFRELPEPITEGPVDENYLLSPGDEIIITVWGQLNLEYSLTVSEEGYITIPDDGGRIFTNGVSLKELKNLVAKRFSQIYASYINVDNPSQSTAFIDVKLAKVRKLLVYIVGEVETQGVYTISSSVATLLNLLNNAGGVKESGSLRKIKIRRANGNTDVVDLYEFLIAGVLDSKKTRLGYGDYIIVPLKDKSATITGEVKRPGIYEMIGNEGLKDLVRFAGGLTSNAYLKRCQVKRFERDVGEKFFELNLENTLEDRKTDFTLSDGDAVSVFPNIVERRRIVEIRGEGIKRPGIYGYRDAMTVKDLIDQAEGLKESAYLERADLVRTEEDFSKKMTIFSLNDLFQKESQGHYRYTGNDGKNFELREMDQVTIYSSYEMKGQDKYVTLEGHVKEPGRYILPENMTLYDLLFSRGGFQDEDFKKRAYLELGHIFRKIPRELEEKVITFNLGKLLDGNAEENIHLEDADRIVVYSFETMEIKPFVTVEGLVKRPGSYPLAEDMTLEDLIILAGGLRPEAYKIEAVIARIQPGKEGTQGNVATIVVPVELNFSSNPEDDKTFLETYDKIVIRNLPEWEPLPVVSVEGQVKYPGSYSLEARQERISTIVKRAGGLKKEAFAEGGVLFRRKDILEMSPIKNDEKEKLAINLKGALQNPGGNDDLILKDGDQIFVPLNPGSVEVVGAVKNPSILHYKEGKKIDYYIKLCGGYTKDADRKNIVAYLPNNVAYKKEKFLFLSFNPSLLPGSKVEVPFRGEKGKIDIVEVRGAVQKPTLIQHKRGKKLDYYINECGGYTETSDIKNIIIYLPDGVPLKREGTLSFNPTISPGSIIEVPFKEEKVPSQSPNKTGEEG